MLLLLKWFSLYFYCFHHNCCCDNFTELSQSTTCLCVSEYYMPLCLIVLHLRVLHASVSQSTTRLCVSEYCVSEYYTPLCLRVLHTSVSRSTTRLCVSEYCVSEYYTPLCLRVTGLPGWYFMSHWHLKQEAHTSAAPCVDSAQACFQPEGLNLGDTHSVLWWETVDVNTNFICLQENSTELLSWALDVVACSVCPAGLSFSHLSCR